MKRVLLLWAVLWVVGFPRRFQTRLLLSELSGVSSQVSKIWSFGVYQTLHGISCRWKKLATRVWFDVFFPVPRLLWLQTNGHDFLCQLHLHRFEGFGFRGGSRLEVIGHFFHTMKRRQLFNASNCIDLKWIPCSPPKKYVGFVLWMLCLRFFSVMPNCLDAWWKRSCSFWCIGGFWSRQIFVDLFFLGQLNGSLWTIRWPLIPHRIMALPANAKM